VTTTPDALVAAARAARAHAYAPYSRYAVGAAVLTDDGSVFTGANVENASFGLTCCAERVAIFAAAAAGHRRLRALAVATENGASPCGPCRQVLREFCEDAPVHVAALEGRFRTRTLAELLPEAFGPDVLGR